MSESSPRIFLSVAELSADLYAAGLIRAFRRRAPGATFFGLTGPASRDAGGTTFHDLTRHAAMLLGVVGRIPGAWLMMRRLKRALQADPPDAAVLVDSPFLNLRIAKLCKQIGVPVLYYVAPQVWAWAPRRIEKVRRRIDRLAVILPFEEAYFQERGVPAKFVGHPLFETLERIAPDDARIDQYRAHGRPVIALLPGSRRQVVQEVFPGQVEVAAGILKRHPRAVFLVACAGPETEDLARQIATRLTRSVAALPLDRLVFDHRFRTEMLLAADLALVASGTITLEVAYRATPMIVMYNHGRLFYYLVARRLITTPRLSLPNILAGRELVPEFMPYYTSTRPILDCALAMLADPVALESAQRDLADLVAPLVRTDVSDRVADELSALLNQRAR